MNVVVTGASGLVGAALCRSLADGGERVITLGRAGATPPSASLSRVWEPGAAVLEPALFDGADAVVHLAGEPIAEGRWNDAKKERIRHSREHTTRILAEAVARCSPRPKVLICASAVGYYGDRKDELLTETSAPGTDFLAEVCGAWEAATAPAQAAGVRVVRLRIGAVLSAAGGALAKMLPLFRAGAGGRLGLGGQYMSFITRDDLVRIIRFALAEESLAGPVNAVCPAALTNRDFTRALARALHRPALLPVPALLARLALGEVAGALMFHSQRVAPAALERAHFKFVHSTIDDALAAALRDTRV